MQLQRRAQTERTQLTDRSERNQIHKHHIRRSEETSRGFSISSHDQSLRCHGLNVGGFDDGRVAGIMAEDVIEKYGAH